jgi:nicotinate-nucleotide adenylyltransferase
MATLLYENIVKSRMSARRFNHSVNVSNTAAKLAVMYGADKEHAMIAGILHDITKESSSDYHMGIIKKFNIPITRQDVVSTGLLHSITGSTYAQNVLRIRNHDIVNAIRYHTTGREGMSVLEKVVFIADFISEDRDYHGVEKIRKCAEESLDLAVFAGLLYTINNLVSSKMPIHPNTILAYNEAVSIRRQRKNLSARPPAAKTHQSVGAPEMG